MLNSKITAVLAAVLIPFAMSAQETGRELDYTETDPTFETGARFSVGLEKKLIPKTLDLSIDEQVRLSDNFSRFRRSYTTIGLDAKILPWLKAGAGFSLIVNNSESKGWGTRHRGYFSFTQTFEEDR